MLAYAARRIAGLVVVLLAMTLVFFCLQSIVPADPARAMAGASAPTATVDAVRHDLGLDQPVFIQYERFLARVAHGDLGFSVRTRQPVAADIAKYLPASLELGAVALILGVSLAVVLAWVQARLPRSNLMRLLVIGAGSAPIFLTALLLAYCFWFRLGWLPGSGRLEVRHFSGPTGLNLIDGLLTGRPEISFDALSHLLLAGLALALPIAAAVGRSLGSALHEVMRQPYIRTARGKGLDETTVLVRHGFRNAASAPLTMVGLQMGLLFGNLLIVERVFAWPGLGLYMVQAFAGSDLPAVLGVSLLFGVVYILVGIAIEITQSVLDPRIEL